MTPKDKNEIKFFLILFLPMIVIGAFGAYYNNIGMVFGGAMTGVVLAKLCLVFGVVKP